MEFVGNFNYKGKVIQSKNGKYIMFVQDTKCILKFVDTLEVN
jgi:hypothetical protein